MLGHGNPWNSTSRAPTYLLTHSLNGRAARLRLLQLTRVDESKTRSIAKCKCLNSFFFFFSSMYHWKWTQKICLELLVSCELKFHILIEENSMLWFWWVMFFFKDFGLRGEGRADRAQTYWYKADAGNDWMAWLDGELVTPEISQRIRSFFTNRFWALSAPPWFFWCSVTLLR